MRIRLLATLVAGLAAAPVLGHEMWLQPTAFSAPAGQPVKFTFLVGDATDVTQWEFRWDKLVSFRIYGPKGPVDQQTSLSLPTAAAKENAIVTFRDPGTNMLVLESHQQPHEMEAKPFEEYLVEDGLTAAIEQRRREGKTDKPGTEIYSRRTKALLQIGGTPTDNVLQPIGQTLEIVPERNPYAAGADTRLPVRILYRGKPLAGALVALTALGTGQKPIRKQLSDAAGRTAFDVPRRGAWMVSVVWTQPITGNPVADFDTVFTSLTFGYPGDHPKP